MDAKKCDRCGRFYEEYGEYKATNNFEFKAEKTSMVQTGTKTKAGDFIHKNQFDLCPICMDELTKFLTDPNAFRCLGNCNECENYEDCEALVENELMENYTKEKLMSKFKATTPDGKTVFGNLIRWELLGCWMVHDQGETLIDPDTIEKLSDGE